MTARIATRLAAVARPAALVTGSLVAAGSVLAAVGVAEGWLLYLAGYASGAVTFPAIAAAHGGRLGRFGRLAFGLASLNFVLGAPVVAMVASYVLRLDDLHLALMGYTMTPIGMIAAFAINVWLVLVGIALVRAGRFPRAGWLIAAGAVIEYPVEFGVLPLPVWAFAMVVFGAGLVLIWSELPTTAPVQRHPALAA